MNNRIHIGRSCLQHIAFARLICSVRFSGAMSDVDFWYRQNVFLYVKENSAEWHLMTTAGHKPMANIDFMNCIHPDSMSFRRHLMALYPSFVRGLRRRLSRTNER